MAAAGDSFNAGYLGARLLGAPPEAAARLGNRLAARVIAHPGAAVPAAATRDVTLSAPRPPRRRGARPRWWRRVDVGGAVGADHGRKAGLGAGCCEEQVMGGGPGAPQAPKHVTRVPQPRDGTPCSGGASPEVVAQQGTRRRPRRRHPWLR